jgi:hypothetical protein
MTDRVIHAIGHSGQGAFIDFIEDPVAVLITDRGDIFLGAGILPGFPVDAAIEHSRVLGIELAPSTELGGGWVLKLAYGDGQSDAVISVGVWQGSYKEIFEWCARVKELIGPRGDLSPSPPSSAIDRIRARGEILAVPGWAISSATGAQAKEYRLGWMDRFLSNVSDILIARHKLQPPVGHRYTSRTAQENWLEVFWRITPRIAERAPDRAIDVCFEPLFRTPPREGTFDVVVLGHIASVAMIYRSSNIRMLELQDRIPAGEDYELFLNMFCDTAFGEEKPRRLNPPLQILSQVGTVSDEVVTELVAEARIQSRSRLQFVDAPSLVEEMHKNADSIVFCDQILVSDLISRWDEKKGARLSTLLFPLRHRIPVGWPFATGDREWGAVLLEAMLAVTADTDPAVRQSWKKTLDDFSKIEIETLSEFLPVQEPRHKHEQH